MHYALKNKADTSTIGNTIEDRCPGEYVPLT